MITHDRYLATGYAAGTLDHSGAWLTVPGSLRRRHLVFPTPEGAEKRAATLRATYSDPASVVVRRVERLSSTAYRVLG